MNNIDNEIRLLGFTRVDWDILMVGLEELMRNPDAYTVMPLVMLRAKELHGEIRAANKALDMNYWEMM